MRKVIISVGIVVFAWILYAYTGRSVSKSDPELSITHSEWINTNSACNRNIVGMQPYMRAADYHSQEQFHKKLRGYFQAAADAGYFREHTVVVLPEYLGTWLVVSGEKRTAVEAQTISAAMLHLVLSNPFQFLIALPKSLHEDDVVAAAIFRMKSRTMAGQYAAAFTALAKEFNVTISAGSMVLPDPSVSHEHTIEVNTSGPLYNTSFMVHADGRIDPQLVRKSFPITSEKPFVSSYPIDALPSYNLSVGRTAVLVCADSWYPESYEQLERLQPELVLVNSYCAGNSTMSSLWRGYDGSEMPEDVDANDIGRITEREAWIKYALPGRLKALPQMIGVNVFLRGELWDLGTDGDPFFIQGGELKAIPSSDLGGIWSLCID